MPCKADSFRRVYEHLAKVSAGSPCWALCRKGRGNDLQGKWCQRQSLKNEHKWLLYDMLLRLEVMRKALPSSHAFRPCSLWAPPGYDSIVITPVYRIQRLKHLLKVLLKGNKKGRNGTQVSWFLPLVPQKPNSCSCLLLSKIRHFPQRTLFMGTMFNAISRNLAKHHLYGRTKAMWVSSDQAYLHPRKWLCVAQGDGEAILTLLFLALKQRYIWRLVWMSAALLLSAVAMSSLVDC